MNTRLLVLEWSKSIKQKRWNIQDNISIGHSNHLKNLLNSIFPFKTSQFTNKATSNALPLGYHFIYNNQSNLNLGYDGYDNYQAPVDLNSGNGLFSRRMWAKGRIDVIDEAPTINENFNCSEKITSVKQIGNSVFVNIERDFYNHQNEMKLKELRTLVYTNEPYRPKLNQKSIINLDDNILLDIELTKEQIFKYSYLTYNLHKIHYDQQYCQLNENLPNIIVQGPFMVTLLLHWFSYFNPSIQIRSFNYKNTEPCFLGDSLKLCSRRIDHYRYNLKIVDNTLTKKYIEGIVDA